MQRTFASSAPPPGVRPAFFLGLGTFLTQFDVTSVIIATGDIARDLAFGLRGVAWIIDAYSLAFVAALLVCGALADRFGRRRVLLAGNLLFAVASLACAAAIGGSMLWAGRALQGIGAAGIVTGAIALVATQYPDPAARARALGLFGVLSGVAMALGPTLGGLITHAWGWRWIFLINIPVCVAIGLAVPGLVPEVFEAVRRRIDVVGVGLVTTALGLSIWGLLEMGAAPMSGVVGIGAGFATLCVFVAQQRRASVPLFDARTFASPAAIGIGAVLVVVSVSYWAVLVFLPAILHEAFAWSASEIGWALLPAVVPMLVLPVPAARLILRWGWRRHYALGLALIGAGDLAVACLPLVTMREMALAGAMFGMLSMGAGVALVQAQLSGALVILAPADRAGMASAATIVFRQGGFAIGIAVLGAVSLGPLGHAGAMLLAAACAAGARGIALGLLPAAAPGPRAA
jgi:MFS family permease